MDNSYFSARTLDDVMRSAIESIQAAGEPIQPAKGSALELVGVTLEVLDPRARLSRTETRGKPFSCLGEFCWYLAASNSLGFIEYYIPMYQKYADGDIVAGGYGPRLLNWKDTKQLETIIDVLRNRKDSRRAVIQLFDATDLLGNHKDIPCTCTLQFLLRTGKLHLVTCMRSNDAFLGLPHDTFCFTMLQEVIARTLSVEPGTYKHVVGSLHLYDSNRVDAQRFIDEGWQSTKMPMPPMPAGDPWPSIRFLLEAESEIRHGNPFDILRLKSVDPYWADLVRLLLVLRYRKDNEPDKIPEVAKSMSSATYQPFIEHQLNRARNPQKKPAN